MRSKKMWKKCLELKGTHQQMEKLKCMLVTFANNSGGGKGGGRGGRGGVNKAHQY
jgi:hypothetical protein